MKSPALLLLFYYCCSYANAQQGYDDYDGYGNDGYANDGYYQQQGDYDDAGYYGNDAGGDQDNLYHSYAMRQQDKGGGAGGISWSKFFVGSALSWILGGKFHSTRATRKLKARHQKEQKQLYSQYYNDVYKLTEQNQELQYMIDQLQDMLRQTEAKHELEALQRDYDEFKQPDIDGDDRISRAEFNMYVKNYLSNYPGLTEKDYPKFEDFDHDGDGFVSFQEYAQQMALQAQQAELEQLYGDKNAKKKAQALGDMAGSAKKGSGGGRNDMYGQLR